MSRSFWSLIAAAFLSPKETFRSLPKEKHFGFFGAVMLIRLSLTLAETGSLVAKLDPSIRSCWTPVSAFGLFAGLVLTTMALSWTVVLAEARVLGLKGGGKTLLTAFVLASLVSGSYSLVRAALLPLVPMIRVGSLSPTDFGPALLGQLDSPVFVALSLLGKLFNLSAFLLVSISFSAIYGVSRRRALVVVLFGYLVLVVLFPVGNL